MSLAAALTDIQTKLAGIPGLTLVATPPEQVNQFPVALVYVRSSQWRPMTADATQFHVVHTVNVDVYTNRVDLAADIAKVVPFASSVPMVLFRGFVNDKFGGNVIALGDPRTQAGTGGTGVIRTEFLTPQPGGLDAVGYRFELDISLEEAA